MSHIALKVASASINQTVVNFTRNVPNILDAIDKAAADGADVLSLQELGLTGYSGDDWFKWIKSDKQQKDMIDLVQYVADYAASRAPNLVISLGFPFFYADKTQPVKINVAPEGQRPMLVENALYNFQDRPFNAVATISGGKIHAISAKSIQPDGAAEYEGRQFASWPEYMGVQDITLYNGQKVPLGKVVAQIGEGEKNLTLYHEICAEGWPGIKDDGSIVQKEIDEGRYLNYLAQEQDISLVINPSASKPEPFLDKAGLRQTLCETGSQITGGGYVYTNCLGVEAAPAAFEGGAIFAQDGKQTHTGERYSLDEMVYTSNVMELPAPKKSKPDVVIPHQFQNHEVGQKVGGPAPWQAFQGTKRTYEEVTRNTTLWLRDYLQKNNQQGYFISLSGGQDSAFGAVMVAQMIDQGIAHLAQQLGNEEAAVEAFLDAFKKLDKVEPVPLEYAEEVKTITREQGAKAGIKALKAKMLTCAYLPSDNSSKFTEDAARFLIEGGVMVEVTDEHGKARTLYVDPEKDSVNEAEGIFTKWVSPTHQETFQITKLHAPVEGIGGTFHVVNVQEAIDSYLEIFAGVDKDGLSPDEQQEMRRDLKDFVQGKKTMLKPEWLERMRRRMPTWENKSDDLLLQNIQARARLPVAWLFGNDEHKIACVTSNWSEAVAGYWTFGGDGHMGAINIAGGVPKSDLRNILKYLRSDGIDGMPNIPSLGVVNDNAASAELRQLKDGEIAQYDEDDMMPYEQLDAIARCIIVDKNSPEDAYPILWEQALTFDSGLPLFASKEELISRIDECCWRWHGSQFKRVAQVITPFLGENVDPHTAVRTTIIGDGFRTGRAQLKLAYVKEQLGGEEAFEQHTGESFDRMRIQASVNRQLRAALLETPIEALKEKILDPVFAIPKDFGRAA